MSRPVLTTLLCCTLLSGPGCLARQFTRDGVSTQEAMADYYTEQAISNLILAKNNLPFVQLRYYGLTVNDKDHYNGTIGVKQTVSTKRTQLATVSRALTNVGSLAATADRTRCLTVVADPVTTQNDIYERYLAFANDPGLFCVADAPPAEPVHIQRKRGHKYYWVPCAAGPAFLDLVLYVSQMRAPESPRAVQVPYAVTIVQVGNYSKIPGRDVVNAVLLFDKPVPNGEATLLVDLGDGRTVQMSLWPVSQDAAGKAVRLGEPTTRLEVQWPEQKLGVTANQLVRRPARVYSHDYPQEAPVPDPVVRQIANDINQIRINVLLNGLNGAPR